MYLLLLISPFVQLNTAIFIRAGTIYQNVATVSSKNKMLLLLFRHQWKVQLDFVLYMVLKIVLKVSFEKL
jgi:hypothetical protein